MILYRPIGQKELELIAASGYTAFPPRLPELLVLDSPSKSDTYCNTPLTVADTCVAIIKSTLSSALSQLGETD